MIDLYIRAYRKKFGSYMRGHDGTVSCSEDEVRYTRGGQRLVVLSSREGLWISKSKLLKTKYRRGLELEDDPVLAFEKFVKRYVGYGGVISSNMKLSDL